MDSDPHCVTRDEQRVVEALAEAWNAFLTLPVEHADDQHELRALIHAAQDKVLARAGRRQVNGDASNHWDEPWSRIASAARGSTIMNGSVDELVEKALSTYIDSRIINVRAGDVRAAIYAARDR